jgi:tetratricopeptide (TPR) repeat protein
VPWKSFAKRRNQAGLDTIPLMSGDRISASQRSQNALAIGRKTDVPSGASQQLTSVLCNLLKANRLRRTSDSPFIVAPLILLGILEGALHLFGLGFPTDLTVPCTRENRPAACYNLFFLAPFFPPGMIKTPQAYAIPDVKPEGTFRIFVLGESAAMGDPDPAYSFSRYLEVMLRERFRTMKFEVVNTGSVAINSHVLLPIARELAREKPDVFIIYSGNNEVVGPYGPGTVLSSSAMSLPIVRGSIFLRSTRTGQLLTKLGTQKKEWGGMEMFLDKQVPATSPLMKPAYSNFEANLRETIRAARSSGARVLVSTVATDLKDCAPFASMHRDGLSEDQLLKWLALFQQGADHEVARSYPEALKAYISAAQIDDQYAELEFRIARALWMTGDYTGAKQHFLRARDLDTLRFRADSKINEINRNVASSEAGAELVDAENILTRESPNEIIGTELVYEHVHLTPRGNYLLARAVFEKIASQLSSKRMQQVSMGNASGVSADAPSEAECEKWLALTSHDRLRMLNEMIQRLQRPPFTNQLNHSEQLLRFSMMASSAEEDPRETAAQYQWALRRAPDDRILHYNFGLFLFDYNRAAAAEELRRSRPWDGFPVFTPDGTPL